jgi:hypothetical protein
MHVRENNHYIVDSYALKTRDSMRVYTSLCESPRGYATNFVSELIQF